MAIPARRRSTAPQSRGPTRRLLTPCRRRLLHGTVMLVTGAWCWGYQDDDYGTRAWRLGPAGQLGSALPQALQVARRPAAHPHRSPSSAAPSLEPSMPDPTIEASTMATDPVSCLFAINFVWFVFTCALMELSLLNSYAIVLQSCIFCVASMFQFVWSWPWPNQNIQHWVYLVLEIYKNRSISIFWLMNLANNRSTDRFGLVRPNAQTNEHVPHPTPTNMVQPPLRTLFLVPISLIFLYDGPMHLPRFLRYI